MKKLILVSLMLFAASALVSSAYGFTDTVTLIITSSDSGAITSLWGSVTTPGEGTFQYERNDSFTLGTTPVDQWHAFVGWVENGEDWAETGTATSGNNEDTTWIKMTEDRTIDAVFGVRNFSYESNFTIYGGMRSDEPDTNYVAYYVQHLFDHQGEPPIDRRSCWAFDLSEFSTDWAGTISAATGDGLELIITEVLLLVRARGDEQVKYMVNDPTITAYLLKKDFDGITYLQNQNLLFYQDNDNVTWDHAKLGLNWEIPGAKGDSDREQEPLVTDFPVQEYTYNRQELDLDNGRFGRMLLDGDAFNVLITQAHDPGFGLQSYFYIKPKGTGGESPKGDSVFMAYDFEFDQIETPTISAKVPSFGLTFNVDNERLYGIQRATQLASANWTTIDTFTLTENADTEVAWRDMNLPGGASKLFYRIAFVGSDTDVATLHYVTRYYGQGRLQGQTGHHNVASSGIGRPTVQRNDVVESGTAKLAIKFDFDYSLTLPSKLSAFAFPDRGDVLSVRNLQLYDMYHRDLSDTTSGFPILDVYRLKRDVGVVDFYEYAYVDDQVDTVNPNLVTWNHAQAGDTWATPGAIGATDRYATPLIDNFTVVQDQHFTIDIPDTASQWLVDVLNNDENLSILYELDSTSPEGGSFQAQHYMNAWGGNPPSGFKIAFYYTVDTGVLPPTTQIVDISPGLSITFPTAAPYEYKIEWGDSPSPVWTQAAIITANSSETTWTDTGAPGRPATMDPTARYYKVTRMP